MVHHLVIIFPKKKYSNYNSGTIKKKRVADIFSKKADLMNARGCDTNLKGDMIVLGGMAMNASVSNIISLNQFAKEVDNKNDREACGMW